MPVRSSPTFVEMRCGAHHNLPICSIHDGCPQTDSLLLCIWLPVLHALSHVSSLKGLTILSHFAKCRYIKTRMTDKDGSVRETAAQVAGDLAQNYLEVKGQPLPNPHPILQIAQDTVISQGRDLSSAGGTALSRMASYLAPLDSDTIKHMLRLLGTDNFMSKQFMLQTFAAWDEDKQRGSGLIIRGRESVLQHIGALVGAQKGPGKHGAPSCTPQLLHMLRARKAVTFTCCVSSKLSS